MSWAESGEDAKAVMARAIGTGFFIGLVLGFGMWGFADFRNLVTGREGVRTGLRYSSANPAKFFRAVCKKGEGRRKRGNARLPTHCPFAPAETQYCRSDS